MTRLSRPPAIRLIPAAYLAAFALLAGLVLPRVGRATARLAAEQGDADRRRAELARAEPDPDGAAERLGRELEDLRRDAALREARLFDLSARPEPAVEFYLRPMLYVRRRCTAMQQDAQARFARAGVRLAPGAEALGFDLPESHAFPLEQCRRWLRQLEAAARFVDLLLAVRASGTEGAPPPLREVRRFRTQELAPREKTPFAGMEVVEYEVEGEILVTLDGLQTLLELADGDAGYPRLRSLELRFAAPRDGGETDLAPDGAADRIVRYHRATVRMGLLARPDGAAAPASPFGGGAADAR